MAKVTTRAINRYLNTGADITRLSGPRRTAPQPSWMRSAFADMVETFRLPGLTTRQYLMLQKRLVQALALRSGYWLCILLLCNIVTAAFGQTEPIPGRTDPGAHPIVSMTLWSAGLWLIGIVPYLALLVGAIRLPDDARACRHLHFLLCTWIAVTAVWWMLGQLTVLPVKFVAGQPPQFIYSRQTFLILTITGQIIPLVLMTPSLLARTVIFLISILSLSYAWHVQLFTFVIFFVWNSAQLTVCYGLSMLLASDERRFHVRSLLAQEALAKVGTFVRSLSHDIPQPVGTISNTLEYMRETMSDASVLRCVRRMQSQIDALTAMTAGTFDLARLVAGTWETRVVETSLPELFDLIKREVDERSGDITITFGSIPYIIMTDPTALYRILINLINNALRYTPATAEKGPGQIAVTCEVIESRRTVRISVVDNGIGIPEDKLEDIFKEFVQLNNPQRNRENGLGLGLSIVQGLCDLLGHKKGVDSKVGEGSRFWVEVPYQSRLPEELPAQTSEFVPHAGTLTRMLVVLVEDDGGQRVSLHEVLVMWGCAVISGSSAQGVIELIRAQKSARQPDFMIVDYNLPERETGLDVIAKVSEEFGSNIPAAIISASSDPAILRQIADADLTRFRKPVDFGALWSLLNRYKPAGIIVEQEA